MSYFESITTVLDKEVTSLLKTISTKFNIDEKELLNIWKTKRDMTSTASSSNNDVKKSSTEENTLLKLSRNELVEMCKGKGFKVGGTKNDLVNRITDAEKNKNYFKNNINEVENNKTNIKGYPRLVSSIDTNGNLHLTLQAKSVEYTDEQINWFGSVEMLVTIM